MDTLTTQGIEAFRNGETELARTLFQQAVQANPRNADALLWLSQLAGSDAERADYLRRVLDIDPNNATARRGLEAIEGRPVGAKGRGPAKPKAQARRPRARRRGGLTTGQKVSGWVVGHPRAVGAGAVLLLAAIASLVVINAARNRPVAVAPTRAPTRAPLNNQIAFISDRSGVPELYAARIEGSGDPTRFTFDERTESDPVWSPDGAFIAYKVATEGDQTDLYIVNVNQNSPAFIARSVAPRQPVAWSPDSSQLAYTADVNGNLDIFAQGTDANASERINLAASAARDYSPAWSPDGRSIAFVSDRDGAPALFLVQADGSGAQRLFDNGAAHTLPAWSPDGRYLAYVDDCRGDLALSIVKADGSAGARVTWLDGRPASIHWSPDGSALLYQVNNQTYLVSLDGRRPTQIYPGSDQVIHPSWSPDGNAILLAALDGSQFDVVILNADGSGRRAFRAGPHQEMWPAWQPLQGAEPITTTVAPALQIDPIQPCRTRDRVAFASEHAGNTDVYIVRDGAGDPQPVTSDPAVDHAPSQAPDRQHIVFASNRSGNFDIYVANLDGSGLRQLTSDTADDGWPQWSPDGQLIAFQSNRGGTFDIYVMRADGGGAQRVTQFEGDATHPAWSPDGRQIAFEANGDIFRVNIDGTNAVNLTHSAAEESAPAWSPDGGRIAFASRGEGIVTIGLDGSDRQVIIEERGDHPAWYPDGRRILFVVGDGAEQQIVSYDLKLGRGKLIADATGGDVSASAPPASFDPALVVEPIPSPTPTPSVTPTPSPTPTSSATPTRTPTSTRTIAPTPSPTRTPSPTPTRTITPTPSRTPSASSTPSRTGTRRPTTAAATGTRTPTPTRQP